MDGVISIVVLLAVAGGGAYLAYRHQQAKLQHARDVAERHGLQIDTATKKPPALGFDLFDRGSSKKVRFQMWRAGEHDSVFHYQYTTGSGDNTTTYEFSAALVSLPFVAPHMTIATETWWTRAKRAVGVRDVEIESPAFNDRYHVRCRDERFAVSMLDHEMIAWMLSPASGLGTVSFEFRDRWMLAHCDRLDVDQLPPLLDWAQSARGRLPQVLAEWYGPT